MKKNRINLLVNREDYQKFENYFERLKLSASILTFILFIIFISFYLILKNNFNEYERMNLQKKNYLLQLTKRRGDEAKINYIQKKYYQLLSDAIKNSSQTASLKSFEVNKNRESSFTLSFSDFDKLMEFLKFAESRIFIDNFEKISLKNFYIIGSKEKKESYELSFIGKFVPIK